MERLSGALMNTYSGDDDNGADIEAETSEILDPLLPRLDQNPAGSHTNTPDPWPITTATTTLVE